MIYNTPLNVFAESYANIAYNETSIPLKRYTHSLSGNRTLEHIAELENKINEIKFRDYAFANFKFNTKNLLKSILNLNYLYSDYYARMYSLRYSNKNLDYNTLKSYMALPSISRKKFKNHRSELLVYKSRTYSINTLATMHEYKSLRMID